MTQLNPVYTLQLPSAQTLLGDERLVVDQAVGAPLAATALVAGTAYQIVAVGTTNWVGIGAATAAVGEQFVATGAGTGTGTARVAETRETTVQAIADLAAGGATDLGYDQATRTLSSSTGGDVVLPLATPTLAGLLSAGDQAKLSALLLTGGSTGQVLALFGDGLWKAKSLTAADVGADSSGAAAAAIAAHLSAADPHPSYTTAAEAAAAAPVQTVALSLPSGWTTSATNSAGNVVLTLGLPAGSSLVSASDRTGWDAAAALAGTAIQGTDPRLTDAREWSAATISQADAEGGTATDRRAFTAQRVRQAIVAWWQGITSSLGRSLVGATDAPTARGLISAAASGAVGSSGLTMTSARLLGRGTAGTGAVEEIQLGANLSLTAGVLSASVTGGGGGTVTSVGLSVPTGFTTSGPVTTSGNIELLFLPGYSLPTTAKQADWDTAFSERLRWDGGATGLNAATGRTSLALGTAAQAATTDFATAAQGALAATALQPSSLASPPAIGNTTPAAGTFTALVATASLLFPGAAPSTPAAGYVYRSGDNIVYLDSTTTLRTVLNSAGNLANLSSPTIARANLGILTSQGFYLGGRTENLTARVLDTKRWSVAVTVTSLPLWTIVTAPTGSSAQFDIRVNGTSIYSVLPTIGAGATDSSATPGTFSTAFAANPVISALATVTFHCIQPGATIAGAGLDALIEGQR
jgi:hypothetical protein